MRRIITIAIIIAVLAIQTAWSVSILGPSSSNKAEGRVGGGSSVPTYMPALW
jgi:hypothetical protein